MCGIVGIVAHNGSASVDSLAQAMEAMAHRGPDDSGVQLFRRSPAMPMEVGLGSCRLAILDLSPAGHQPMRDPETGNCIVYNGEIYNFREVRAKLEQKGLRFFSQSDTEVVLKAYGEWGEKCLEEFRGMFAFCIFDARQQRLFLARDRMGIKPLYYSAKDGHFIFASEVRALVKSGLVPRRLNASGIVNYLTFGSLYGPSTMIEGVYALSPGHYLLWENGRIKELEYWDIDGREGQSYHTHTSIRPHVFDEKELRKILVELRGLLEESVRLRLVSDVPVGVFLSGGIDSSSIVALLSQNGSSRVNTFSIVFKELDYSEARYSRTIAQRFNTDHHEIVLSQRDAVGAIPDAICAMDQPTMNGINTYIVSRETRRAGMKVALSGLGGDEVFGGYESFKRVPKMDRLSLVWRRVPASARNWLAAVFVPLMPAADRNRKLATFFRDKGAVAHPYVLSRTLFVPDLQERLLKSHDATLFERANEPIAESLRCAERFDALNRVSYLELRNYMMNTLLRDTDFMSMAHSLEVRSPFIDHKLVEYLFALPGQIKINRRAPKFLLVKAIESLLPSEVVYRPKRGFALPFEHWLRGELSREVEKALFDIGENPIGSALNPESVRGIWQDFLNGQTSWSRPWSLYVLSRWAELYL